MKLLWLYYDTEKPLPNSLHELSMKVNGRDKEQAISGLLGMFFTLEEGSWHHKRCDREIAHYHQQLEAASKAGKASAAKRALNKRSTDVQQPFNERSTIVQPTNNQQPITNNHSKKSSGTRLPEDWKPSSALLDFMKARRPDLDPDDVTLRFCNFWHSKAGASATKLDWDKTFQNWVLSENQVIRKPAQVSNLDAAAGRGGI
jgi:uncharacterized protein YdaU (DUF1376 family)